MRAITLSAGALVDVGLARSFLDMREATPEDVQLLCFDINAASAEIETRLARRMKSRTYAGTKALVLRGSPSSGNSGIFVSSGTFVSPEWPVTAVASIKWYDSLMVATTVDLTGVRFFRNLIETPADGAPRNTRVELSVTAGYLAGYDDEHDTVLADLADICLRLVQIKRQDRERKVGRGIELHTSQGGVSLKATTMPPDLVSRLAPYRRIG